MHDPMTVAFTIPNPFARGFRGYRPPLVTVWHVDPENTRGMVCKMDDTCGWFVPPYSPEARARILSLGEQQFGTIFQRRIATAEGKDYAYLCYEPSCHDAIYWAWRAIEHSESGRGGWQYGDEPTGKEMGCILDLASNPVNNLRVVFDGVQDEGGCALFFLTVYENYLRLRRPWYRHPRWHVWHWSIQVHPWQTLRRWLFSRCATCGKRFRYGESVVAAGWAAKKSRKSRTRRGELLVHHAVCFSASEKEQAERDIEGAPV